VSAGEFGLIAMVAPRPGLSTSSALALAALAVSTLSGFDAAAEHPQLNNIENEKMQAVRPSLRNTTRIKEISGED
jgi:hypothetical protein